MIAGRKRKCKALISRFFYWCKSEYHIINPVEEVERTPKQRSNIIWYDVPQVEDMLNNCNSYWAGLLATMAYTGIGPKELSGITVDDFENLNGEYFLYVEENSHRGTKRAQRRRSVNVDKEYLLPRIQNFISDGHVGSHILFAIPKDRATARDKKDHLHREVWIPDEIGRYANANILAEHGMKVKYLRNTMGSIMLRSGYTVEEVSAVLGNSPEVVREHYARLLSSEIYIKLQRVSKQKGVDELSSKLHCNKDL